MHALPPNLFRSSMASVTLYTAAKQIQTSVITWPGVIDFNLYTANAEINLKTQHPDMQYRSLKINF